MMKIKICGLTRTEDIVAINGLEILPDYIGFVFAESRRKITPEQARELRRILRREICTVGVFVNETKENILVFVRDGTIDLVQLHGAVDEDFITALKAETTVPIIKAVSVQKAGDAQSWNNSAADFLLLDHKGGGTGEAFDWGLIGKLQKPFFLAGGLSPENVTGAVTQTSPFAVDVSSGVEVSYGVKCAGKINEFVKGVIK
jgi:phosphoribosylanthranilate isomerase